MGPIEMKILFNQNFVIPINTKMTGYGEIDPRGVYWDWILIKN